MSSDEEKERHRKHIKARIKEKKHRSEIAKRLINDQQYRQKKTPRREEAQERAFRKYKKWETEEDSDV